ncbi:hypothetical protein [Microbacterium sp. A93]|uniref:hypothetical protein n=1 Tax=Microbacterium sp. A93 TaxID=3450716 RepID=UPI003F42CBBB
MSIIILLAVLALAGLIATVIELRRDGFHAVATDWSRVADHDALDSAEASISYR